MNNNRILTKFCIKRYNVKRDPCGNAQNKNNQQHN